MANGITHRGISKRPVQVRCGHIALAGDLAIPEAAVGVVLFVHGSGSSRLSPRNRMVAHHLQQGALATLLFDLLTPWEEAVDRRTGDLRFDIGLLAGRVAGVTRWLRDDRDTRHLAIGYFGASTGAAAALVAAAEHPGDVAAVVSRGGRPDLAGDALPSVAAPTLLIVGGADLPVLELNERAIARMTCEKSLRVVPGATHLFEEPGTLEEVARLARGWFERHLQ
jgi:pimeloyl-ACP methyl ester carboxylesterase